jgi:hypothetical protein
MMMRFLHMPLIAVLLLSAVANVSAQSRLSGGIRGVVRDDARNPVIGALVRLLPAEAPDQAVKTLRTGADGTYLAKNLTPGVYRVRAEARGFLPVAQVIEIKPQVILSFDFELRRTGTLAEQREDREDYRWSVRASRRHVLRFNKNGEVDARFALRIPDGRWRGHALIAGGVWGGDRRRASAGRTMSVALAQELSPWLSLALAAHTNGLEGYPGRWEMELSTRPRTTHRVNAAIAMTGWRATSEYALEAHRLELRIADRWEIIPALSAIYGLDLRRTSVQGRAFWDALPRLGVHWTVTERTRIRADLSPFALHNAQADLAHGGVALPASYPVRPRLRNDGRVLSEGHHWHISLERVLGDHRKIEIAVFQSAVPSSDASPLPARRDHARSASEMDARHGIRVLYTHPLGDTVRATIGYAFGYERSPHPEERWNALLARDFHLLAGRVDAMLTRTRTRLAAHFRAVRGSGAIEADPFYNISPHILSALTAPLWERSEDPLSLPLLDPGLTVVIAQELPNLAFLPGRWEAIIEARNVIAWPHHAHAEGHPLLLVRAPRSIRGSLALRF